MAATPEQAAQMARSYMQTGMDGIKPFTGVYKGEDEPVVNMDPAMAKAAVDIAHAEAKPVFAHPQKTAGTEAVIAAGVDVMAHTVASRSGYSPEQLARFTQQNVALTPTLSLFAKLLILPKIAARIVDNIVSQLKELFRRKRLRSRCDVTTYKGMKRSLIYCCVLVFALSGGSTFAQVIPPGSSPYLPPPPPPPPPPKIEVPAIPKMDELPKRSYAPIAPQKSFGERISKCLDDAAASGLGPNERATYSRSCATR